MLFSLNSRLGYLDDDYFLIHVCCSHMCIELFWKYVYQIFIIFASLYIYGCLCENKFNHVWFSFERGLIMLALILNECHIFIYLWYIEYYSMCSFYHFCCCCNDESNMTEEMFLFCLFVMYLVLMFKLTYDIYFFMLYYWYDIFDVRFSNVYVYKV